MLTETGKHGARSTSYLMDSCPQRWMPRTTTGPSAANPGAARGASEGRAVPGAGAFLFVLSSSLALCSSALPCSTAVSVDAGRDLKIWLRRRKTSGAFFRLQRIGMRGMGHAIAEERWSGLMFRIEGSELCKGKARSTSKISVSATPTAESVLLCWDIHTVSASTLKSRDVRWIWSGARISERSMERYPNPEQRSTTVTRGCLHGDSVVVDSEMCFRKLWMIGNASPTSCECQHSITPHTSWRSNKLLPRQ